MDAQKLMQLVNSDTFSKEYADLNWTGSFREYLNIVMERPEVARTAFQRAYDMIMSYGSSDYVEYKKKITHYNFFDDPVDNGKDAIFGLDVHLQKFVNVFKAAAHRYGPEKRVLLLHGPVGSSKSTIAVFLKKASKDIPALPKVRFTHTPGRTWAKYSIWKMSTPARSTLNLFC